MRKRQIAEAVAADNWRDTMELTKEEIEKKLKELEDKNASWKKFKDGSYEMALDGCGYYKLWDKLEELNNDTR